MGDADSPLRRFLSEMRRRRIFRTAALYIVATWLVMQVADVVFPALDIPERAIRYVLVAAMMGFPAAIIFGWIYDIGAHGIRRTAPAGHDEQSAAQPLSRSDYIILTAFGVVAAAILYGVFSNVAEPPRTARGPQGDGPPMVAVLPFVSKSLAGESESFADGVHDDLLTQLSKLQSIRVISRTSVMEYRDTIRNIRDIGAALGADAILEGGVQSAGNRIRINAQLIDARTDAHLWAETYDRELSLANIFEVQSEIARAITSALRATLTEHDAATLAVVPTENMAAYRAYHHAIELKDTRGSNADDAIALLEEAVALDPGFTRAWAELVGSFAIENFEGRKSDYTVRAEHGLEQIRTIAPESADYLIAKTYYTYYILKDYDLALDLILQAQDMMPSYARLARLKAWIQRRQADYEGWVDSYREAHTLDPRDLGNSIGWIQALLLSHRYDEAKSALEETKIDDYWLSFLYELVLLREHRDFGRWGQAVADLQKQFDVTDDPHNLWGVRALNREFQAAESLLESMPGSRSDPDPQFQYKTRLRYRIWTYWLMGKDEQLSESLSEFRTTIEKDRKPNGDFARNRTYLDSALVAAAEGDSEKTELLIRRWRRVISDDPAGMIVSQSEACQILAIAGSAAAAVSCIRYALDTPSYLLPYLDLYMPFYDPIRNEQEFIDLLAEIEAGAGTP